MRCSGGYFAKFFFTIGLALFSNLVFGQDDPNYSAWLGSGKKALSEDLWDDAVKEFEAGLGAARSASIREREADFNFFLGLTYQRKAETSSERLRKGLLETAAGYYLSTLEFDPNSGSTMNNLGRLYADLGVVDKARTYYEAALKLQDGRQSYYSSNYARALDDNGLWEDSAVRYLESAKIQPDNADAYRGLEALYRERGSLAIVDALWNALDRGYVYTAQERALSALDVDISGSRDILLSIIVVSLARQVYDPNEYQNSSFAEEISKFWNDPEIGGGVRELALLHEIEEREPSGFPWWRSDRLVRPLPNSTTRAQSFVTLIRSVASKLSQKDPENRKMVENYLKLAIDFEPDRVNPAAFLDLAEIYYKTEELTKLESLAETYKSRLFSGKSAEYRRGDWLKIYDFHRALGVMYGRLEIWGAENEVDSAIFQLENARRAARELGPSEGERIVDLEPGLIDLLVKAYSASNMPEKGIEVRVDAAGRYLDAQMFDQAERVLEPTREVSAENLTGNLKTRYQKIWEEIDNWPNGKLPDDTEAKVNEIEIPVAVTSSLKEIRAGLKICEPDISGRIGAVTSDGLFSGEDFETVYKAAGKRLNPCEMAELREALAGTVFGGPEFKVSDMAKIVAKKLIYLANLDPGTIRAIGNADTTLAGTTLPDEVREVVDRAKLNGATVYDMRKTNNEGDPIYAGGSPGKRYPAWGIDTQTMSLEYTEITPEALQRDMRDTSEQLQVDRYETVQDEGRELRVARYKKVFGGTGSIGPMALQHYHPIDATPQQLVSLGYPADLDIQLVQQARSKKGEKWASNCAVMSDGSIHCLPAIRRHPKTGNGLFLSIPSLARGHQFLWNGHINVVGGQITYIGTSGRIANRAGRGREIFLNPIPLLKAWGFKLSPELQLVSEHESREFFIDHERAIIYGPRK